MAIGGKTLGIFSGLTIGLMTSVILAVLNPIDESPGEAEETQQTKSPAIVPKLEKKTEPPLYSLSKTNPSTGVEKKATAETLTTKLELKEPVTAKPLVDAELAGPPRVGPDALIIVEAPDRIEKSINDLVNVVPNNTHSSVDESSPEAPSAAISREKPDMPSASIEANIFIDPNFGLKGPVAANPKMIVTNKLRITDVEAFEPLHELNFGLPLFAEPNVAEEIEALNPINISTNSFLAPLPIKLHFSIESHTPEKPSAGSGLEGLNDFMRFSTEVRVAEFNLNIKSLKLVDLKTQKTEYLDLAIITNLEPREEPSQLALAEVFFEPLPSIIDPENLRAAGGAIIMTQEKNSQGSAIKSVATSTTPKKGKFIQIGFFRFQSNADTNVKNMEDNGIPVQLVRSEIKGKTFWRVIVGPALSTSELSILLNKIKSLGYFDAYFVNG